MSSFRTGAMNGLLMYLVDSADMFYVSLSMQDGALYLYAHPDNELMTQAALPYHMDFIILFFSVCTVCPGRSDSPEKIF